MILIIDNYDSFTFNIYDCLCRLGEKAIVKKNDEVTSIEKILALKIEKIIISPGPGGPDSSGICLEVVAKLAGKYPLLGICLGHQIVAQHYGHKIIKAPKPMHGKIDVIYHDAKGLFNKVPSPMSVVRYHSLIVAEKKDSDLVVTSTNREGIIMGLRHKELPIETAQFHPEAIKTDYRLAIIDNFLRNTA